MRSETTIKAVPTRSPSRIAFTLLLVAFSAFSAFQTYPFRAWLFSAGLGVVALIIVFLRVGWTVPCMIAGSYVGEIFDAGVKGGTAESKMWEAVHAIAVGTAIGFALGIAVDVLAGMSGGGQHEHGGRAESPPDSSDPGEKVD
jgi:hypothetical protein